MMWQEQAAGRGLRPPSGFQWAELLRLLGTRDSGPPELRISSIDLPEDFVIEEGQQWLLQGWKGPILLARGFLLPGHQISPRRQMVLAPIVSSFMYLQHRNLRNPIKFLDSIVDGEAFP